MRTVLVISLTLNLVLAAFALRRVEKTELPPEPPGAQSALSASTHGVATVRTVSQQPALNPWQAIDTPDTTRLVANLRAVGCPETTIRDIIMFRVSRRYFEQLEQADHERALRVGFKGEDSAAWRERVYAHRELRNEMSAEIENALGQPWESLYQVALGFPQRGFDPMEGMSLGQRQEVRAIKARFERAEGELAWAKLRGDLSMEDDARLRGIDEERRKALMNVLSPGQLEEYLCRDSEAADFVRNVLPPSRSEQEFRALVRLALELGIYWRDDRMPLASENSEWLADMKRRRALFDQRSVEILGPQRIEERNAEARVIAEAERQQESVNAEQRGQARMVGDLVNAGATAEQASRLAARLKELQPEMNRKFGELHRSLTGTPEEKERAMRAAIQQELESVAREIVGDGARDLVQRILEQHGD